MRWSQIDISPPIQIVIIKHILYIPMDAGLKE